MELEQTQNVLQDISSSCSQPLHVKRIEKALEIKSFMQQFLKNKTDSSDEDSKDIGVDDESERTGNARLDSLINSMFDTFTLR